MLKPTAMKNPTAERKNTVHNGAAWSLRLRLQESASFGWRSLRLRLQESESFGRRTESTQSTGSYCKSAPWWDNSVTQHGGEPQRSVVPPGAVLLLQREKLKKRFCWCVFQGAFLRGGC
jgi:hypothetical protein